VKQQSNKLLIEALATLEEENEQLRKQLEQSKETKLESTLAGYPPTLKAKHVAEILGISEPTAYSIMRLTDFPSFSVSGRFKGNVRVFRDSFQHWLENRYKQRS
jgi:predicted DNA-binding transcriptional regulator AlpA